MQSKPLKVVYGVIKEKRIYFTTKGLNSSSDAFFLFSIIFKAYWPTRYLVFGLSDVMASRITIATSRGDEPFSNLGLDAEIIFWINSAYDDMALLPICNVFTFHIIYKISLYYSRFYEYNTYPKVSKLISKRSCNPFQSKFGTYKYILSLTIASICQFVHGFASAIHFAWGRTLSCNYIIPEYN